MSTYFRTEGSEHIVNGCFERQKDIPGGETPVGVAPLVGGHEALEFVEPIEDDVDV